MISTGPAPLPDPHRVELRPEQFESPDSESLSTGRIAIVVDTPLIDNVPDSRDKR
jgi:hypothetical protein